MSGEHYPGPEPQEASGRQSEEPDGGEMAAHVYPEVCDLPEGVTEADLEEIVAKKVAEATSHLDNDPHMKSLVSAAVRRQASTSIAHRWRSEAEMLRRQGSTN